MITKVPPLPDMLDRLIGHPSVSSARQDLDMGNRAVIDELANWLGDLGFRIEIQPLRPDGKKANLIARRGNGDGGLILSGHTDTVPYDENLWRSDPFKATPTEDGYRGLGATDMKGFFAVALSAMQELNLDQLGKPLLLIATADEESSFAGAHRLSELELPKGAGVIIGEPTDMLPVNLHKGIMMESIRVTGVAGHSSDPSLGISALEVMHEVIMDLLLYRAELQTSYRHPGFSVPVPTLNPGCIHGGDNPNRICSKCELQFDLRPVPGMQPRELQQAIDSRLLPIARKWGVKVERVSLLDSVDPFEQDADSDLVRQVIDLCGTQPRAVAFATEAPFYQKLGLDTLVLGPGSIKQAHQANELISYQQIEQGKDIYKKLIRNICN